MTANPHTYTQLAQNKEMTLLFTDVRNFTSMAESIEPQQLSRLMPPWPPIAPGNGTRPRHSLGHYKQQRRRRYTRSTCNASPNFNNPRLRRIGTACLSIRRDKKAF